MPEAKIWTKFNLGNSQLALQIGTADIRLRKSNKEIQMSVLRNDLQEAYIKQETDSENNENAFSWTNFIVEKNSTVLMLPALPDRPLVLRSEDDIFVLPGKTKTMYMRIPVWLNFYAGSENASNFMMQVPSVELSSTWFGEPDSGILSYSMYSPVLFTIENVGLKAFEILCPVKVINDSPANLKLERLSVDTDHLRIYQSSSGLISNEIRVKYKGEQLPSDVSFGKSAPAFASESKLISHERIVISNNILKRSFSFLRSATTY